MRRRKRIVYPHLEGAEVKLLLAFMLLTGSSYVIATPTETQKRLFWEAVYGKNYERLKDVMMWYGHDYRLFEGLLNKDERGKLSKKQEVPEDVLKELCSMRERATKVKIAFDDCKRKIGASWVLYDRPSSEGKAVGYVSHVSGFLFKGRDISLSFPSVAFDKSQDPSGEASGYKPSFPVLDYRIVTEGGVEREWMRLPTMSEDNGEAWLGTSELNGDLPVFDVSRARTVIGKKGEVQGLGLVRLSQQRLFDSLCYMGVAEGGKITFRHFVMPMNWGRSFIGLSDDYLVRMPSVPIAIGDEYAKYKMLENYKREYSKYPPHIFTMSFYDFFYSFSGEMLSVHVRPLGGDERERNCNYPEEWFYKKIPKKEVDNFITYFGSFRMDSFSDAVVKMSNGAYAKEASDNPWSEEFEKMRRGESWTPFGIYIRQMTQQKE